MCGDTGLPRFYVKAGNDVQLEGGFVELERALRAATARATKDVPLRSNRVHPLTRRNPGTNVGVMAPNVDYRFEPEGDWIDLTAVHKGGLFGSDYRMLFPGDGIPGIKRFFVDTLVSLRPSRPVLPAGDRRRRHRRHERSVRHARQGSIVPAARRRPAPRSARGQARTGAAWNWATAP